MSAPATHPGSNGSFTDVFPIAPSDILPIVGDTTNNPKGYPMGRMFVTVTGAVAFKTVDSGTVITIPAVAANTLLPFLTTQVMATGTTATVFGCVGRFHA